ncbi:MAG: sigma-70 family RNA polymerase sigma factor [Myxococcales bacterium]|nr:sigma-70 family RNA polymerase sigma factor [Planctomycetota bacterium]MCA9678118.1 sigma-70 family RNA polymerase sigma factor [Myxococcales bacterium]
MTSAAADPAAQLARLRAGDQVVFRQVVRELDATLRRLARGHLRSDALVDEVVQDTWLAVIKGLDHFEERASFRTWVCRILLNRARTVAVRDGRTPPLSSLGDGEEPGGIDADRFAASGKWATPPVPWQIEEPARLLADKQTRALVEGALAELPARQREVVTLRDVHGWTSEEVCNALDVTETNQRVLLHRGRAKLRSVLEARLAEPAALESPP